MVLTAGLPDVAIWSETRKVIEPLLVDDKELTRKDFEEIFPKFCGVKCLNIISRLHVQLCPILEEGKEFIARRTKMAETKIAQAEQIAEQPACRSGDDDCPRLGQGLKARCKVRRVSDHGVLAQRTLETWANGAPDAVHAGLAASSTP